MDKLKVVVVTGLSGAGKTNAADWLEDQGYFCVDNMPPSLIRAFVDLTVQTATIKKAAIIADIRGGNFFADLISTLEQLEKDDRIQLKILFIEASDKALIKRYNETRRNHPLGEGPVTMDVIEKERETLKEVRARADYVIDTTDMKVAEFRTFLQNTLSGVAQQKPFRINIKSFGYKKGLPLEADLIMDMRFIPNPYYIKGLKKLTGNNKKVQAYVMKHQVSKTFVKNFYDMIMAMAPAYRKEGKNHLNLAFGCTGGQHRSVTMANHMAEVFRREGFTVTLEHRDIK